MNRVERCLAEIRAIREIAEKQAVPYVARSRIGRLALTTAVLVAEEVGMSPPDLPGHIQLPDGASPQSAELAARCVRLADISRHIIQPSEPLADRWERGWHQLLKEIDLLEEQLRHDLTKK